MIKKRLDLFFILSIVMLIGFFIYKNMDSIFDIIIFVFTILLALYPWYSTKWKRVYLWIQRRRFKFFNYDVSFDISVESDTDSSLIDVHKFINKTLFDKGYIITKDINHTISSYFIFKSKDIKNINYELVLKKFNEDELYIKFKEVTLSYRNASLMINEITSLIEYIKEALRLNTLKLNLKLKYTSDNPYLSYFLDTRKTIDKPEIKYDIRLKESDSDIVIQNDEVYVCSSKLTDIQSVFKEYVLFDKN